jgi:CheY-like chemotaxis protein
VVDDDAGLREGLVAFLDRRGYEVFSATQGEEGLERLHEFHPKVVLLDLVMPVMDGLSFLAERNRHPALARIPVVAMTATGDGGGALERNADALVSKPFEPEDIVRLVDHYARRS